MVVFCFPNNYFLIYFFYFNGSQRLTTSQDWQQNLNFNYWFNKETSLKELDAVEANVEKKHSRHYEVILLNLTTESKFFSVFSQLAIEGEIPN